MRLSSYLLSFILCILMFTACDSGDILDENHAISSSGKTIKLTAYIKGVGIWESSGYNVALAGFSDNSKYAVIQRAIPSATLEKEETVMILSNVSSNINHVELAITNSLRKRIITLASLNMVDYENYGPVDTIYMNLGAIDVDLFGCMQNGIFNKACISCHGGNGRSAGNLNLVAGNAYSNLVDVASTQKEGYIRVTSGEPENSLLRMILNNGGENLLHYNHTEVLSSQFKTNLEEVRQLIDDWIVSLK